MVNKYYQAIRSVVLSLEIRFLKFQIPHRYLHFFSKPTICRYRTKIIIRHHIYSKQFYPWTWEAANFGGWPIDSCANSAWSMRSFHIVQRQLNGQFDGIMPLLGSFGSGFFVMWTGSCSGRLLWCALKSALRSTSHLVLVLCAISFTQIFFLYCLYSFNSTGGWVYTCYVIPL